MSTTAPVGSEYSEVEGVGNSRTLAQAEQRIAQAEQRIAQAEQRIADRYSARLDALESEKRGFEWTVWIFTLLLTALAAAGIAVAYRFGKSFNELRTTLREDAASTFRTEFLGNTEQLSKVAELRSEYKQSSDHLKEITAELQGYTLLAAAAERASGFDPLVEYYAIDKEIDDRYNRTVQMLHGDDSVQLSETTRHADFRQRAAVVFERLLVAVKSQGSSGIDGQSTSTKVGPVMLFNAAASASKVEMDFVSVELMEVATRLTKAPAPEIASRYIRQQLALSMISPQDAKTRLAEVLSQTTGFDVHLVVSEAFNIGQRCADPVGVCNVVNENLSAELRSISYVRLNGARMRLMGSGVEDWGMAQSGFIEGVRAFAQESPTARWYEHSAREIAEILRERPDYFDMMPDPWTDLLGTFDEPRKFAQKYGDQLASVLANMGRLSDFIQA